MRGTNEHKNHTSARGTVQPQPARGALDHLVRWGGATLFAAALLYFLYCYAFPFAIPVAGTAGPATVLRNVGLFTFFAVHHSIFAREPVRRRIARLVHPALERSVYVWVASLLFIGVCALWAAVPGIAWDVVGVARMPLVALQLAGIWITLRSAAMLNIRQLAGVAPTSTDAPEFRTAGPYGWVRHPIYAGWLLLVFAVDRMTMTRLVFAVASALYLLAAIPFEERSLRRIDGGAYAAYMRKIRWRVLPGIY